MFGCCCDKLNKNINALKKCINGNHQFKLKDNSGYYFGDDRDIECINCGLDRKTYNDKNNELNNRIQKLEHRFNCMDGKHEWEARKEMMVTIIGNITDVEGSDFFACKHCLIRKNDFDAQNNPKKRGKK